MQRPETHHRKPRIPRITGHSQKLRRGKEGRPPESQREPCRCLKAGLPPPRALREFHVCCLKPHSSGHSAALGKESSQCGPHPVLGFSAFLRLASLLGYLSPNKENKLPNQKFDSPLPVLTPAHQAPRHVSLTPFYCTSPRAGSAGAFPRGRLR